MQNGKHLDSKKGDIGKDGYMLVKQKRARKPVYGTKTLTPNMMLLTEQALSHKI